ncbi:hypothetical protein LJC49_01985 [Ruminococcaceae bacterium OttesenSCG-928-I18]|nr:hypothetical protein [Ruminococcaceae bacterium OttesenSCG-928-I18]
MRTKKGWVTKLLLAFLCTVGLLSIMAALGFIGYSAQAAIAVQTETAALEASAPQFAEEPMPQNPFLHNVLLPAGITILSILGTLALSAVMSAFIRRDFAARKPAVVHVSEPIDKRELLFDEVDRYPARNSH